MSYPLVKLSDIAPAKSLKVENISAADQIWQLTLDHIEPNTGSLLKREIQPFAKAGSSTHWFDQRHVLYSKLRPYLNKVLVPDQIGLCTTELVPMLPDEERLDREYLAYYLRSTRFVEWISSQTAGAKMPRVAMETFWNHELPLPPLAEQKRIAAILDKADAIRRKRQQAIQLADDFLRSVFLDMFGDPVTNPKGWEIKRLGSIATKIGSGSTPRGGKESYVSNGISLIRSLNIHDDEFLHKDLAFITNEQAAQLSNVTVQEDDVLLNITGASVCRCSLVDNQTLPARVNQHVCIIRVPSLNHEYLLHLLISPSYKKYLLNISIANGATREALTKEQIENLPIPIPSRNLLVKFSKLRSSIKNLKMHYQDFDGNAAFNSLSQKAFSGQL